MKDPQYQYHIAANYKRVKEALLEMKDNPEVFHYRAKKKPVNVDAMSIKDMYLIEAFACKLTKELKTQIHSVDLMFLIWMMDYEYVSRGFMVKSLGFLTIYTSYKFLQRNKKNKYITEVRARTIGIRNGSAYYLSAKGADLAKRIYEVLKTGKIIKF